MFLDITLRRNPGLINAAFKFHRDGIIKPDTYILDLDAIIENARVIKHEGDKYGVKLYFMTKQIGRNPYVAGELMKLGYEGAVAVDYKEAEVLGKNGIKIGHLGHLVQIPSKSVKGMLTRKPEIITVFSLKKAREISDAATELNMTQHVMMRVIDEEDVIYPGQYGGFYLEKLYEDAQKILCMPNIVLGGVTSFPCFLVDSNTKKAKSTNNVKTLQRAREILEGRLGIKINQVNMPSVTCSSTIGDIARLGGTHGEPGHGLSGTTPLHAINDEPEVPAIVYVSEVSHKLGDMSYCYGGGYYRRSNMEKALIGRNTESMREYEVEAPDNNAIDYYIGVKGDAEVGDTAVLSFRTQIFVTRSEVAVVGGIKSGNPELIGIYDSLGRLL